jgi:uncharacterized protein (DUF362 family)
MRGPKHCVGIDPAILDINAAVRPDFAIVDGINRNGREWSYTGNAEGMRGVDFW